MRPICFYRYLNIGTLISAQRRHREGAKAFENRKKGNHQAVIPPFEVVVVVVVVVKGHPGMAMRKDHVIIVVSS